MSKIVIWPDIYRERGHWLPIINLAQSLQDIGYTIEFIGIKDCAAILTPFPFDLTEIFQDIYPLGHSNNDEIEPIGQQWKSVHLMPIVNDKLDHVFAPTEGEAPALLISGYFSSLENLLIHYKYNIPVVTTTTYLRHPQQDPAMNALSKLVHMPKAFARNLMNGVKPGSYEDMTFEEFVEPLESENCPELIPCVKELDCINDISTHLENVHYVEPMVTPVDDPPAFNVYTNYGIDTEKDILFATCGSHVDVFLAGAQDFFNSMVELMSLNGMENYHLIITAGPDLLQSFQYEIVQRNIKNITVEQWVSQPDVLAQSKVVFLHGGLASIKEAINVKVPIVIVPQVNDQFDNALRIEKCRVGKMVSAKDVSAKALKKAMIDVTTNHWIIRNIQNMKEKFDEQENRIPKPSIEIISGLLPPLT